MITIVKKIKGIGLLELMLALAIITVLLMMAVRYFAVTSSSQKSSSLVEEMQYVNGGLLKYSSVTGNDYSASDLTPSLLKSGDYVSAEIVSEDTAFTGGAFISNLVDANNNNSYVYFTKFTPTTATPDYFVLQAVTKDSAGKLGTISTQMCTKLGMMLTGKKDGGTTTQTGCDGTTNFYYVFKK